MVYICRLSGGEGGKNIFVRTDFRPPTDSKYSLPVEQSKNPHVDLANERDIQNVQDGEQIVYTADVDSRLLYKTLTCHSLDILNAKACISVNKAFILHLTLPNGVGYLAFYLPILNVQEEK